MKRVRERKKQTKRITSNSFLPEPGCGWAGLPGRTEEREERATNLVLAQERLLLLLLLLMLLMLLMVLLLLVLMELLGRRSLLLLLLLLAWDSGGSGIGRGRAGRVGGG